MAIEKTGGYQASDRMQKGHQPYTEGHRPEAGASMNEVVPPPGGSTAIPAAASHQTQDSGGAGDSSTGDKK